MVMMPAFGLIDRASQVLRGEYLPPDYFLKHGTIYIPRESIAQVLSHLPQFPELEQLPKLSSWESAKLFQLEAPNPLLGHILETPSFDLELAIASSDDNPTEQAKRLVSLLEKLLNSNHTVNLRQISNCDRVISLYLALSGFPEWKALCFDGSRYYLYLEPGYAIELE